jgi:hypothetical protein
VFHEKTSKSFKNYPTFIYQLLKHQISIALPVDLYPDLSLIVLPQTNVGAADETMSKDDLPSLGKAEAESVIADLRFCDPYDDQSSNKLCKLCSAMTIRQLRSLGEFAHHRQARFLRAEAESQNGCPLCAVMWKSLVGSSLPSSDVEATYRHYKIARGIKTRERSFLNGPIKAFLNPDCSTISELQIYCQSPADMQESYWNTNYEEYSLEPKISLFGTFFLGSWESWRVVLCNLLQYKC